MAQALCSCTLAAASLAQTGPVAVKSNARGLASLKIAPVSRKAASRAVVAKLNTESSCQPLTESAAQATLASSLAASVFSALAAAPSANAAQLVADLADSDGRPLVLLGLLVPALGWVLFNILQPALRQFDNMKTSKAVVGALGLSAAGMFLAQDADAAQEVATLAADNRPAALLVVLVPAIGWVLFNILGPALRQLSNMGLENPLAKKVGGKKKGIIGAIGLGSAMALAADPADAAELVADLAADNRPAALLVVLVPAIGWVLFNILGPALRQLSSMGLESPLAKKSGKKVKGLVSAIGLSAGALAFSAESADAAQEVASLAADNRPAALAVVLLPAIGWVLFNITRPALNQLSKMTGQPAGFPSPKKGKK